MRRIIIIIVIVVAALMAATIYFNFDPASSGLFPRCIFYSLTGYKCPGCGTQRAIHALLHGEVLTAWHYNAALLVAIPVIALYGYAELRRESSPRMYARLNSPVAITTIIVAVMLWWILRNLL